MKSESGRGEGSLDLRGTAERRSGGRPAQGVAIAGSEKREHGHRLGAAKARPNESGLRLAPKITFTFESARFDVEPWTSRALAIPRAGQPPALLVGRRPALQRPSSPAHVHPCPSLSLSARARRPGHFLLDYLKRAANREESSVLSPPRRPRTNPPHNFTMKVNCAHDLAIVNSSPTIKT